MFTPLTGRPTWAEVDLNRLGENFRAIKSFCGGGILYMAVIKANAYGHGAIECGKRLEAEGADWFGAATLEEGVELRQAGIFKPILIFGGVWPGQARDFLNFDLTPMIFTLEHAKLLNDAAVAANRVGGILFGVTDDILPEGVNQPELQPVMSVNSRIAMVKKVPRGETIGYSRTYTTGRDSLIATVPIGYNDGYDRALSNKGEMIVRGKKVPVVGRISMDWVTIDVTDAPDTMVGDIVVVLGSDGEADVTAEEIARKIDTISYEVTCGIASRVPRIYK